MFSQNIYFQLWLITVSYFIILFWLIRNWHLNNYENIIAIVATVPFGTVATVQNLNKLKKKKKDKVPHQNGTVNEQWKTLYEQCENTVGALALLDIRKKKLC